MGIWNNDNGLGSTSTPPPYDSRMGPTQGLSDLIRREHERMQGQHTVIPTKNKKVEKSYPLEGRAIAIIKDMERFADESLCVELLIAMVTSKNKEERMFAALHRKTPMSMITMHLLSDNNEHVRYLAEKRVEAWEGDDE